ncbi:MAG: MFS transporter [Candidatus Izemoplasmatales bacterium]|nr:MFS transporter [Candidatus Izemoplasmatales bacterium]
MKNIVIKLNKYVYYGWIIVVISGIALFMSSPGQTYSISVFINEYNKEFNYSSTLISSAYSIATTISGFLLIFMGRAVDKNGQRKMMMIVGILLALTAFYNSFVSSILMISLGFFFLRYFGQGSMTLIPNSLVPQWFHKKRALAISLSGIGSLVAALIIPSFNLWLISLVGWQVTWRIWSLILIVVFLPLVYLFVSNKPEDNNIAVENEVITDKTELENALKQVERESFTLQETLKTKEFWLAGIISMIPATVSTGLTFHFFKIMELRSITNESAAMIIGLMAFPAFFIPFIAKGVIDKYPLKYTLAVTMIMVILSLLFLIFFVSNQWTAIIFVLFYGFASAIINVSMNVLWPNYFGRKNLGSIRGAATVFMVVGSALGTLPFGLSYDLTGSYNIAIIGMMSFSSITFVLSFFIKKPERQILNDRL